MDFRPALCSDYVMAKISGIVTRLVAAEGTQPARVFFRPNEDDKEVVEALKHVDGSKRLASGEIAVAEDISKHQVGDEVEFEI